MIKVNKTIFLLRRGQMESLAGWLDILFQGRQYCSDNVFKNNRTQYKILSSGQVFVVLTRKLKSNTENANISDRINLKK